jgi:hypothetical protein
VCILSSCCMLMFVETGLFIRKLHSCVMRFTAVIEDEQINFVYIDENSFAAVSTV